MRARWIDRLQQRPLDQEAVAVELLPGGSPIDSAGGIENPQLEQLPRVVPFVDSVGDVETFVALQADQVAAEHARRRCGQRGLADAGLAFEEQRPPQFERQKQRHRERAIGDVMVLRKASLDLVDGRGLHGDSVYEGLGLGALEGEAA